MSSPATETARPETLLCVMVSAPPECSETLAQGIVEQGLAACVQVSAIRSHYRWQGTVEKAEEVLLMIKTRASAFTALERWVLSVHPYEVPEILAIPVDHAHGPYQQWLLENVSPS